MSGGDLVRRLGAVTTLRRPANQVIGRSDDVRLVLGALTDQRLVTLVGPGGVGKTALAAEVVDEAEPEFARIVTAGLVNAQQRGEVACLISSAVMGEPIEDLDRIATALAATPTLLVLDNCEQAVDAVAEITQQLMARTPDTRVLATSRRPLEVAGEVTVAVRPLAFPTDFTTAPVTEFPAVQLFLERARQADPTFELTDAKTGIVATICAKADGIPLAIELAAVLVRGRRLADILAAMTDGSGALGGNRRDLHDHQRSIAASLEWSRRFLSGDEEQLLDRLSVFAGGFTAAAARRIGETPDDIDLTRLVDHSLVLFDPGAGRYRLLEVIRSDAEARFGPADWDDLVDRHIEWCQDLAAEIGTRLYEADPQRRFPAFNHEIANLGSALRRCWQRGDVAGFRRILAPMANWWVHHARPEGVEHWPELLLDDDIADDQSMSIQLALAYHFSHRGRHELSVEYARKTQELARTLDDPATLAAALMGEGNAAAELGDVDRGIELHLEAMAVAARVPGPYVELWARVNLARLDPAGAAEHLIGTLEQAEQGFTIAEALVRMELSRVAVGKGRPTEAARMADQSVEIMRDVDYGEGLATALTARAEVAASAGDAITARAGFDESLQIGRRINHEGVIAGAREGLAALPDAPPARVATDESLSERELAVARLLRGDLTQREIADELYVAPSTVKSHVKSIYRKLGVAKRSHAITVAAELGLFDS